MPKTKSKPKTVYICAECGHEHPKWNGQCGGCHAWNTLEEFTPELNFSGFSAFSAFSGGTPMSVTAQRITDIDCDGDDRLDTGTRELNRVLGGGLVKGSVVLLSGEPGIGKSTLLLQICGNMKQKILYASGEESGRQIKIRADRLGIATESLLIAQSTDLLGIVGLIEKENPDLVIIDSIQTMKIDSLNSSPGSVTQVRECTNLLTYAAKSKEVPIMIIGHVNKDGGIAGPKVLEHIVDTVLCFEGDRRLSYRILRAVKNRFGSTNEIGVFEMRERGLVEVENPSAMLLSGRPSGVSGISVLCTMEGARPILAEVQALVTKSGFSAPRRVSNGFDYNRLCLILAVLEKRTGLFFGSCDVYINVIGGLSATEPAADLAVALALYSGLCDEAVSETLAVFGEVGLGGEIRSIGNTADRIRECSRMGFDACIIPKSGLKQLDKSEDYGIKIIGAANLSQMFKAVKSVGNNEIKE
ncbi:MAG: DNA repair protein RadA [Oscillospiraceae bacterium]|nr:DNA repair protein RadA [Oscillospiraceae bacterium]